MLDLENRAAEVGIFIVDRIQDFEGDGFTGYIDQDGEIWSESGLLAEVTRMERAA